MNKVHVNFIDFDIETHTLFVSFQQDDSDEVIGPLSFDIHHYSPDDFNETVRLIAQQGMEMMRDIEAKRKAKNNEQVVKQVRELLGKRATFDVNQLVPAKETQAGGYGVWIV